ncbi:tetratricopeptide repeat protein [Phorcysia thermohydrogeniphila]|uniref:Glycosyl transferase family 2 n=1 Tax=Phorcysia thermohydrogeniphila TaxID=936138 RepID=A0A4V2PDU5_9BACT|nr:hypothetical protein [Phorcysia thermohydrogeniphila]TCK06636.1 hypothetical protein CLV27_0442 [Phorcysia thermohydrogeniphila]
MEKVSLLVLSESEPKEEFLEAINENADFIHEVIFSGEESDVELDCPVKFLGLKGEPKGKIRNALVESANSENLLFVSSSTILEEDAIEELLEERESTGADIVFPNIIFHVGGKEEVKNFEQPFEKELNLVASLSIEDYVPEWGILTSKSVVEKGKGFDSSLGDYDFYDFLYRNIRWLKVRLAELTYVTQKIEDSFIDTSWRSYVLRKRVLQDFDWEKELFPFLSWHEKPEAAEATALTIIGNKLSNYYDFFNATDFYRRALLKFHNQESLRCLINALKTMGLFEEAKELLSPEQGVSEETISSEKQLIENIESIIKELEKAVEDGKVYEVITAIQDVVSVYEGAPIYNILGVLSWIQKKEEEAYRFFFKAVTINPINQDYLFNLASVAKRLKREEEVKKLIQILVGDLNL